jgi:multisubunit Na+/H+ antiporter MnhG subunit
MDLVRQARQATSAMEPPEPTRGIYVSAYLVAVGLFSYLSTDVGQVYEKVHGKTKTVTENITHPATAVILIVLALAAGATIYWRRRYVTGIAFMLTAAIGMGVPFPNGLKDLAYLTFLIPAGYVLWMLMFRMNKQQKAWLSAHTPAKQGGASSGRSQADRKQPDRKQAGSTRSRRARDEPAVTASGRTLPPNSGRYTQPRTKPKAGARKS